MLIAGNEAIAPPNPEDAVQRLFAGQTFYLQGADNSVPGFSNFGAFRAAAAATNLANNSQQKLRWRASKGSAPVNRFTRAIGNNSTETWHRTMPVGITVSASIAVDGSVTITVSSGGDVLVQKLLAGDLAFQLSAAGAVVIDKLLAGASNASVAASGDVTVIGTLAGLGAIVVGAGGSVGIRKDVAGAGSVSATGTGAVFSPVFITGGALSSVAASAGVSLPGVRGDALVPVSIAGSVIAGASNDNAAVRSNRGAQ